MADFFSIARTFIENNINAISANILTTIDPTATPTADAAADATAAGEAILAAISGGFTLQTFTSSDSAWAVPPGLANSSEAYAFAIGGGGKAEPGTNTPSPYVGGAGGSSGGYKAEKIDPSTLAATLNITVGAAASTNGTDGGTTSIVSGATTIAMSVVNKGSMATVAGYAPSDSMPGAGGAGGQGTASGTATAGSDGDSSAFSAGGTGGTGLTANSVGPAGTGGTGGAGQYATTPLSGGGGGGGGGGARRTTAAAITGGAGGSGGFPGAGSGGGGGANGSPGTGGAAGTPANGLAALMWK